MVEWVPGSPGWKRRIGLNLEWKVRDCSSRAICRETIKCVSCSGKKCQAETTTSLKNHWLMWALPSAWCPSKEFAAVDKNMKECFMAAGSFFYVHANICLAEHLINDMTEWFWKDFGSCSHQHQADDIFSIPSKLGGWTWYEMQRKEFHHGHDLAHNHMVRSRNHAGKIPAQKPQFWICSIEVNYSSLKSGWILVFCSLVCNMLS